MKEDGSYPILTEFAIDHGYAGKTRYVILDMGYYSGAERYSINRHFRRLGPDVWDTSVDLKDASAEDVIAYLVDLIGGET